MSCYRGGIGGREMVSVVSVCKGVSHCLRGKGRDRREGNGQCSFCLQGGELLYTCVLII